MSDAATLQAEIDVLLEDIKIWEDGTVNKIFSKLTLQSLNWSEEERCTYLEKKRDTFKGFFLLQVASWEKSTFISDCKLINYCRKGQREEG